MRTSHYAFTITFALCAAAICATTALAANQSVAKDLLRAEDGSVVAGTALATKSDMDRLDRRLDDLEKAIVRIQTWGLVIGCIITLASPILTALWIRKFGTPKTMVQDDQGRLFIALEKNEKR